MKIFRLKPLDNVRLGQEVVFMVGYSFMREVGQETVMGLNVGRLKMVHRLQLFQRIRRENESIYNITWALRN